MLSYEKVCMGQSSRKMGFPPLLCQMHENLLNRGPRTLVGGMCSLAQCKNSRKSTVRCYKLHASNGRLVLGGQNGRDGMEWLIRAILHSLSAGGSGHLIGYCNLHCFWPSLNDCPLTSTFRLRSLVAFFLLPGNYCFNKIETSDCFSPLEIFQWFQLKFQVSEVCF